MSAIPQNDLARYLPGDADPSHLIPVAEAAKRSGLTTRAITLRIQAGKLLAFDVPNPRGGRPLKMVDDRSGEGIFAPNAAQKRADEELLARLPESQRLQALAAAALLTAVEARLDQVLQANPQAKVRQQIELELNYRRASDKAVPSVPTYYRWREQWLAGGRSPLALVDRRALPSDIKTAAGAGRGAVLSEEAWRFFWTLWGTQERKTEKLCYELLQEHVRREALDWSIPSLKTIHRRLMQVPEADRQQARYGDKARKDGFDPYLLRDYSKMASDDQWVSDHHTLDVRAIDDLPGGDGNPRRMWVTTWMDVRSRCVVGWRLSRGPNSTVVMASFMEAALTHGIPRGIYIDNGKDYRCQQFAGGRIPKDQQDPLDEPGEAMTHVQSICRLLQIEPTFAIAFNARAKLIEPWHGNWLCDRFSKMLPGYTGHNTLAKPETLNEDVKAGRILKWSEILPLLDQILQTYNLTPHHGVNMDGRRPADVYREEAHFDKRTISPKVAALLLMEHDTRTVGRNGIQIGNFCYGWDSPELMVHQGERVVVRMDLWRAGAIWVYDLHQSFICEATCQPLIDANATPEDRKQANVRLAQVNKLRRQLSRITLEPLPNMPDAATLVGYQLSAAQRRAAEEPSLRLAPPRNITPVDFSLAGQLPEAPPAMALGPAPVQDPPRLRLAAPEKTPEPGRTDAPDSQTSSQSVKVDFWEDVSPE